MKRDQWYEKTHKKEMKAFKEFLKMVSSNLYWLTSVRVDKESIGSGYRVIINLQPRKDGR